MKNNPTRIVNLPAVGVACEQFYIAHTHQTTQSQGVWVGRPALMCLHSSFVSNQI